MTLKPATCISIFAHTNFLPKSLRWTSTCWLPVPHSREGQIESRPIAAAPPNQAVPAAMMMLARGCHAARLLFVQLR
jgi:hypothetical protein